MRKKLGDSKVDNFDCRIVECTEKVSRLDVAMHDAMLVHEVYYRKLAVMFQSES